MQKFGWLLFLLIIGLNYNAYSQNDEVVSVENRQLGATFSTLSGTGIYYLFPTTEKDNVKLTGIFIYNGDESGKYSFYSIGGEYQRDLYEDYNKRGHLILASHFDNIFNRGFYSDEDAKATSFTLGAGFGFDFGSTNKGMVVNAHLSYQLTTNLTGEEFTRLGWGAGVGIGFNF